MDEHRSKRVSEAVREELTEIIGFETADPAAAGGGCDGVTVSPDRATPSSESACGGGEREQNQAMAALEHAGNYLRHELASRLSLRRFPNCISSLTTTPTPPARVDILLKTGEKKSWPERKISPKVKQTVVVLFLLAVSRASPPAQA